jgi:cytochrome c oxidase assembly protein subunit 15
MNSTPFADKAHRRVAGLLGLATLLALCVIVFGGFVRLSNAGLSCPDWPTCYGRAAWPTHEQDIAHANQAFPERPVESHKAWREQFHRHLAALLGTLVLAAALLRNWRCAARRWTIVGAVLTVVVGIGLYIKTHYAAASALAIGAELALLGLAWRKHGDGIARLTCLILAVVIFQALLGMWTVTWLLKPIVVMGHLLGGLTTFALLLWATLRAHEVGARDDAGPNRVALIVGLALLAIQIALGGWTSANYAALACGLDFPTCLGQWWPATDFREAFVLWRGIGVDYEGGVLDGPARAAIQLTHRLFALLVTGHLIGVALAAFKHAAWRAWGAAVLVALIAQVSLGIANVVAGLPLAVATAHNAGAAVLLALIVYGLARRTSLVSR